MTGTTGLLDNFGRTVAAGSWGTADSGQSYTLQGTTTDFAVSGGVGTITPSATGSSRMAVADLKAYDWNISHQWKISALPASGIVAVGAVGRYTNSSNYYRGSVQISTAGAVTALIERNVAAVITGLSTVSVTGLTVAANTLYGLRFAGRYDWTTQTMNLYVKVWPTTAAEPYGWSAVYSELVSLGPPAASLVGAYGAVSAATGPVISYDVLATVNHALPFPVSADPMCYDSSIAYPRQTVAQSLASAIDTYMGNTIDPDAARTTAPTWVRISKSNWASNVQGWYGGNVGSIAFDTVEFNSGTPTDLSANPASVVLGTGVWAVSLEAVIPPSTDMYGATLLLIADGLYQTDFRVDSGTGTSGTPQVIAGGAGQLGGINTIASGTQTMSTSLLIQSASGNVSVSYYAMTAVKLSDWF